MKKGKKKLERSENKRRHETEPPVLPSLVVSAPGKALVNPIAAGPVR